MSYIVEFIMALCFICSVFKSMLASCYCQFNDISSSPGRSKKKKNLSIKGIQLSQAISISTQLLVIVKDSMTNNQVKLTSEHEDAQSR